MSGTTKAPLVGGGREGVLQKEDVVLNRALQEAVGDRDVETLLFGRNEIVNQHFHAWLCRAHDDPRHWG